MIHTFTHYRTGETFVADPDTEGQMGASSIDGTWGDGTPGTIFHGEKTNEGRPIWSVESVEESA
jgi:beta-glucosidase-like glycosyl hydrolase